MFSSFSDDARSNPLISSVTGTAAAVFMSCMCGEIAGGESEVAQCLGPTIVSERANELVGVGLV